MAAQKNRLVRSALVDADIAAIRDFTVKTYRKEAAMAYGALLRQPFKDIREDSFRPGSRERSEIAAGVRSWHISLSRERAASLVKSPRHLILYYQIEEHVIAISRVLHDARDLSRHVPEADIERAGGFREPER